MKRARLTVTALAVLAVAGCGTGATGISTESTARSTVEQPTSPPSSPSESPNPNVNERDNIEKELGEKAGVMCDSRSGTLESAGCDLVFTLDKVTECTGSGYHGDPVEGMRRIAWFTVTTSADYGSTGQYDGRHPALGFSGYDLRVIGAESGTSRPGGGEYVLGVCAGVEAVPRARTMATEHDLRRRNRDRGPGTGGNLGARAELAAGRGLGVVLLHLIGNHVRSRAARVSLSLIPSSMDWSWSALRHPVG